MRTKWFKHVAIEKKAFLVPCGFFLRARESRSREGEFQFLVVVISSPLPASWLSLKSDREETISEHRNIVWMLVCGFFVRILLNGLYANFQWQSFLCADFGVDFEADFWRFSCNETEGRRILPNPPQNHPQLPPRIFDSQSSFGIDK